ncbi:hypothetical protein ACS0TY_035968 [Phlomoides rotata]
MIMGSADGLLLMCKQDDSDDEPEAHLCNPITCDYINLPCPQVFTGYEDRLRTWGFGSSKMSSDCLWISCFDLETEHFSTLSAPFPWNGEYKNLVSLNLFVWGDCLGLCDNTSANDIVIWLMKEYGVGNSWTKEFVTSHILDNFGFTSTAHPIKVFRDGDILIQWNEFFIFYSSKTKSSQKVDILNNPHVYHNNAILYTPSFLSLKSFGLDVSTF